MKSDIEIAQAAAMQPITQVAAKLGLSADDIIPYGKYKAKIPAHWPKRAMPRAS